MRTLVRSLALAALISLLPAAAAAAKQPKPAAWAKKHHLKGAWRTKDTDHDGAKNLLELKLGTDPRKADSDRDGLRDGDEVKSGNDPRKPDTDRDGIRDGAEHAGVVTAFDGDTITIRQFHGAKLTAPIADDADCAPAADVAEDPVADNSTSDGGGDPGSVDTGADDAAEWVEDDGTDVTAEAAQVDPGDDVIDLGDDAPVAGDASTGCAHPDLKPGAVLRSAELETVDGVVYVVALELAS